MPDFKVELLRDSKKVTCPECGKWFEVDLSWPLGVGVAAVTSRHCPYCSMPSSLPGTALIYDGVETMLVSKAQVEALGMLGLIRYSVDDGPKGIIWRPTKDETVDKLRRSLI